MEISWREHSIRLAKLWLGQFYDFGRRFTRRAHPQRRYLLNLPNQILVTIPFTNITHRIPLPLNRSYLRSTHLANHHHLVTKLDLKHVDSLLLPLSYLTGHQIVHFICFLVMSLLQLFKCLLHLFLLHWEGGFWVPMQPNPQHLQCRDRLWIRPLRVLTFQNCPPTLPFSQFDH